MKDVMIQKCEHVGPKVTTSHEGNTTMDDPERFTVADDLKESSKIIKDVDQLKDLHWKYKIIGLWRIATNAQWLRKLKNWSLRAQN